MTDQGRGGRQPPPDDRTLLDPLNADELRALREARQKMQAAKGGPAVAHQVVIGPDSGEDIGDAPTRAIPSLPQFENQGASLEKIPTGSNPVVSRSTPGQGVPAGAPTPQQPMSNVPTQPAGPPPGAQAAGGPPGQPGVAGPTGFGENTLLWMAPPKPPPNVASGAGATGITGEMRAVGQKGAKRYVKAAGAFVVVGLIVAVLAYAVGGKKERAVVDLHTNPPKAAVKINGAPTKNVTPMKLNLGEGTWEIEINLEGYKPHVFTLNVEKGAAPSRRDIELEPISKAGLQTISVAVQPVAANITIDGTQYPAKRNVNVPNLDPNTDHKIVIEAGGYLKIEQDIPSGQLKKTYNFILQQDENNKPGAP